MIDTEARVVETVARPEEDRVREVMLRWTPSFVALPVREAVNAQLHVPGLGKTIVDNVLVHELPDAGGVSPNALVWRPGQVDAARCGSGTPACMALFHHRGPMAVGSTLTSQGRAGFLLEGGAT